jgi:hypothetical protein
VLPFVALGGDFNKELRRCGRNGLCQGRGAASRKERAATTAHLALQHDQLMSKRGILCFKPALRLEERGNYVQQVGYQRDHLR